MRKPRLSKEDFEQLTFKIKELSEWGNEHPPVMLWAEMLNLTYTGNMAQAMDLARLAWPKKIDGRVGSLPSHWSVIAAYRGKF